MRTFLRIYCSGTKTFLRHQCMVFKIMYKNSWVFVGYEFSFSISSHSRHLMLFAKEAQSMVPSILLPEQTSVICEITASGVNQRAVQALAKIR